MNVLVGSVLGDTLLALVELSSSLEGELELWFRVSLGLPNSEVEVAIALGLTGLPTVVLEVLASVGSGPSLSWKVFGVVIPLLRLTDIVVLLGGLPLINEGIVAGSGLCVTIGSRAEALNASTAAIPGIICANLPMVLWCLVFRSQIIWLDCSRLPITVAQIM